MGRSVFSILLIALIACFTLASVAQQKKYNMKHLDKKEQQESLNLGLDAGLMVNEIKETLVQLYAYCGFPRSLNAINAFIVVLDERKAKGITDVEGKTSSDMNITDKYQSGKKNLQTLTGVEEIRLSGANAFAPAIDSFLKVHLFADIFNRDVLSFQMRELITISALAAMTGVAPQLQAHIGMGMNTGINQRELEDAFGLIDKSVNTTHGDLAREILVKVLATRKP
jgi:4-carboxymuconolactone decarboxylase